MQFLMGLNDSYSAIRGQILLMNPLPSIRQAYSSVSQEEKKRILSSTHAAIEPSNSAAMAVQGRPNPLRHERFNRPARTTVAREADGQLQARQTKKRHSRRERTSQLFRLWRNGTLGPDML
jgi:hypothetical protein